MVVDLPLFPLGTVLFLGVLQLQQVLHYSALAAGLALLPLTLVLMLLSSQSGKLATRIGPSQSSPPTSSKVEEADDGGSSWR